MTGNHEQLATPLFKASTPQVNQTPILNHLHYIISFAIVNNLCYNKSMKGRKMWYDTNKLKDLNGIKVIIITKRKRKKRNEKKHNEKL